MNEHIPPTLPSYIHIQHFSTELDFSDADLGPEYPVCVINLQIANNDPSQYHSVFADLRKYDGDIITKEYSYKFKDIPPGDKMHEGYGFAKLNDPRAPGYWYLMGFRVDETFHKLNEPLYLTWPAAPGTMTLARQAGCFVTTAAYGDPNHPMVCTFRRIREDVLSKNSMGRSFIRWYYHNGEKLALLIKDKPFRCAATRAILSPIATTYLWHMRNKGPTR